jgi:hypothetical protein
MEKALPGPKPAVTTCGPPLSPALYEKDGTGVLIFVFMLFPFS